MIALVWSALAGSPELEARLLGEAHEEPEVPMQASLRPIGDRGAPWGVLGALGLLGFGALWWRNAQRPSGHGSVIRVLGRQTIPHGGLVVVEVESADGEPHRLLLGTGPGGPKVLADLDTGLFEPIATEDTCC